MKFKTREVHAGVSPDPVTGAILTPIYQSTTYVQESVEDYMSKGYSYSRSGNPTVVALEERIRSLEGGAGCACFGTGMAATTAVMMALLNAGEHAVVSDVVYGGTHRLSTRVLNRFGVEFSFVDTSDPDTVRAALRDNTRLLFTETPANPTLKLTDIAAISEIARERDIPHAVDNTFLTPAYQLPLELGADLSVHSTTKYMDGHNQTVGGAVVAASREQDESIRFVRNCLGSNMSPMVAFFTLQGCKTLSTRLDAQSANALEVARFLETHPMVDSVCYPGSRLLPPARAARPPGERSRGHVVVRGEGGRGVRATAHEHAGTLESGREPRLGGIPRHPFGDHDPRRYGSGGAPAGGHHRRPGAAFRGPRRSRRLDRGPPAGARPALRFGASPRRLSERRAAPTTGGAERSERVGEGAPRPEPGRPCSVDHDSIQSKLPIRSAQRKCRCRLN